jgi:hypothetical protein
LTWRELREGAIRAVDADPDAGEVAAAGLEHVREVGLGRAGALLDCPAAGRVRIEELLDLLLLLVDELAAAAEQLHAVVLRRVVGGGDDDAEVVREKRHGRRRKDAAEDCGAASGDDAARDRLLEHGAGLARVAADENAPTAAPQRRRLADPLDELRRQVGADHATHTICPEIASSHRAEANS